MCACVSLTCGRVEVGNGMDVNAVDEDRGRVHVDLMREQFAKHLHIPEPSTNTSVTQTEPKVTQQ